MFCFGLIDICTLLDTESTRSIESIGYTESDLGRCFVVSRLKTTCNYLEKNVQSSTMKMYSTLHLSVMEDIYSTNEHSRHATHV